MPKSKDPFITVNEKGRYGSATVIKKGSKYAEQYEKSRKRAAKQYSDTPIKGMSKQIDKSAAQSFGAGRAAMLAKRNAEKAKRK